MKHAILPFIILSLTHVQDAAAQDSDFGDPIERAYELNDEGFDAFEAGRFAEAAQTFAEAWQLSGESSFRKNEALAWFRAEKCDNAIDAGNMFLLGEKIPAEDRLDIHSVIANCKAALASTAIDAGDLALADIMLTDAEALEPDPVARDRVAAVRVELAEARAEEERRLEAAENETLELPPTAPPPKSRPVLGYALTSAGGALLAGTIVYNLMARGWATDVQDIASDSSLGSRDEFDRKQRSVKTARTAVPVLYAVAGITLAGGVTLIVTHRNEEDDTSTIVGIGGTF